MRRLFLPLVLMLPAAAQAEITAFEQCAPAIAASPQAAREDASVWHLLGGGTPARLCEVAALEAMGAFATAARLLTAMAENPNRALDVKTRADLFEEAARLWLVAGQPAIANAALDSANKLAPDSSERPLLRARAAAASQDWNQARRNLDNLLASDPDNSLALALRAASLRHLGDPQAALVDARRARTLDPSLAEALFEIAAAQAESGDTDAASEAWLTLIKTFPGSSLARLSQRNLQSLSAGVPAPTPPRPEPRRPHPRPAVAPSQ
jgi:tetratricopeptide (TPR) repeat protein